MGFIKHKDFTARPRKTVWTLESTLGVVIKCDKLSHDGVSFLLERHLLEDKPSRCEKGMTTFV